MNWVWRTDKVREEASTGTALHLRHHGYKRGSSESIIAASCERRDLWDRACICRHPVKPIRICHYFWGTNQTSTISLLSPLLVRPPALLTGSCSNAAKQPLSVHLY